MRRRQADIVVIGGGIVGAATAYYAARRGARVVLVEKGVIGEGQSGRAWGFVRRQGRPAPAMALMATASGMWAGLAAELEADIEFIRAGNLAVAETAGDLARLEEGYHAARAAGVPSRLLTGAEVRALIPALRGSWRAGLYSEDDGHAEPLAVTTAFATAAVRHGATVWDHCTALGIDVRDGHVCAVETDRGRVQAPVAVAAAGVWTPLVLEPLGIDVPVRIVRSSVAATRPAPPLTRLGVWGPQVALRQRTGGSVYLGNGYRGASADHDITLASLRHLRFFLPAYRDNWRMIRLRLGRELLADLRDRWARDARARFARDTWTHPRVNPRAVRALERGFYEMVPELSGLGLERTWAGVIEITPDLLPILGPVAALRGLHLGVAASHGFSMGPVIGRLLAESILDGHPSADLSPFRLSRFGEGTLQRPKKVL